MSSSMPRIAPRIAAVAESATLAIDAKAKSLKAAGEPVIGFGAGEPDFPTPAHIVAAAQEAVTEVSTHRYSPAAGLPALREAVAEKTRRDSGFEVSAGQVVITNGGKHAVYQSIMTIVGEGDEVIIPGPFWVTYPECVGLAGGKSVFVDTDESTGFKATPDMLEAARTPRTKALIFCSPSNPTGAVYTREEIAAVGQWALDNGVWVITDEIYEHLVYGSAEQHSLPVVVPEIADRCIVVNGVAKTFAMTGWRVGWMISPPDVTAAATNFQSHLCSNVANVAQRAALAALNGPMDMLSEMRAAYDRRRRIICAMLNEINGVSCLEPEGAFYVFPNIRSVCVEKNMSSMELAAWVLDEAKVAFVPGEAFGAPGYARFSYALGDEDLVEGITRLQKLLA